MAWNRTHRPTRISDLHLEHVKKTLTSFLKAGYVPQSLIFAGPKGTGKTTAARVIAAVLNSDDNKKAVQEQYHSASPTEKRRPLKDIGDQTKEVEQIISGSSTVVRELDAASNRGIDDIRQLKESAFVSPSNGLVSVYILDEAHMLTQEAWNALLKLLEEPPSHTIFILATTELHKIPETIRSRCFEVLFKNASDQELTSALMRIAKIEKVSLSAESAQLLSRAAQGSFRDAIKLFEQASQADALSEEKLTQVLSSQTDSHYTKLIGLLLEKNEAKILQFFTELREVNQDEATFLRGFAGHLHGLLVKATLDAKDVGPPSSEAARYILSDISKLVPMQNSPLPHLQLELALLDIISRSKRKKKQPPSAPPAAEPKTNAPVSLNKEQVELEKKARDPEPELKDKKTHGNARVACERWEEVISSLSEQNFGLATLLRSTTASSPEEHSLRVQVYYHFHKEQLEQPKFFNLLMSTLEELSGGMIQVQFEVVSAPSESELVEAPARLSELAAQALM
ncbi:MAG: DNA polymerase III, subunit gamma and tau [Candidatus Pacebacteria bacterium CG_4_10_14_0_8_um_filter_42_14]|nr:MAG: DNA polymerase III, subunit gamma and tau [Candidatus Pacebacteria bacterium CG_4_10_14_0_8_um_filter_42_14]